MAMALAIGVGVAVQAGANAPACEAAANPVSVTSAGGGQPAEAGRFDPKTSGSLVDETPFAAEPVEAAVGPAGSGTHPATGGDELVPSVGAGLGALLAGLFLLMEARRRREAGAPPSGR
jgi:hypothetical protein